MWDKIKKVLGYVWASPITLVGLAYVSACHVLGWYKWNGVHGDGLVYTVCQEKSPSWLKSLWKPWSGQAIGNVVVINGDPTKKNATLEHELVHVRQVMRLGVFQPIIYGAAYLGIKFGCEASDPYYSNPFEVDARRAVGQVVDMEGALKKLKEKKA